MHFINLFIFLIPQYRRKMHTKYKLGKLNANDFFSSCNNEQPRFHSKLKLYFWVFLILKKEELGKMTNKNHIIMHLYKILNLAYLCIHIYIYIYISPFYKSANWDLKWFRYVVVEAGCKFDSVHCENCALNHLATPPFSINCHYAIRVIEAARNSVHLNLGEQEQLGRDRWTMSWGMKTV